MQLLYNIIDMYYHIIYYHLQRKEYVRYAKVFPLAETFDIKLPSKWYRRSIGGLEILFGLALALIPSRKFIIFSKLYQLLIDYEVLN